MLVDLSNVCRDEGLCRRGRRADLNAFRQLTEALNEHPVRFGRLCAVADRSLFSLLEKDERAKFKQLVADQVVVETRMADETLIAAAFGERSSFRGGIIVSRDGFADFRAKYPEIQGSTQRFLDWRRDPKGKLTVRFRDMGRFTHMRISRKIEEGEYKQRRMFRTTVRDRAIHQRYRCVAADCVQAKAWPDWLPQMPEYDRRDDSFRCPSCGGRLELVGTRPKSAQLVVFVDGREACRLLLEEGEDLVLGRDDRKACMGLSSYVSTEMASEISRRHAQFSLERGVVRVEDLGSKNGTWLETRKGAFKRQQLHAERPVPLGNVTRVRVASDVVLELSGRKNPFDGIRLDRKHTVASVRRRQTQTGG